MPEAESEVLASDREVVEVCTQGAPSWGLLAPVAVNQPLDQHQVEGCVTRVAERHAELERQSWSTGTTRSPVTPATASVAAASCTVARSDQIAVASGARVPACSTAMR